MKRSLSLVLSLFILLSMITVPFADQIALLGTVELGKTIFNTAETVSVPVRFLIQNQSQDTWTLSTSTLNASPVYNYQVYYLQKGQTPVQVASGLMQPTNAQDLDVGQSDVYAVGNITLNNPSTGFYRVYINSPTFRDTSVKLTVKPNAGGAFLVQ